MKLHQINVKSWIISMSFVMCSMFGATSAHAADGCKFLLCIAGPWASISECVPTVREVFRDLARGRAFPTCDMSGSDNTASNAWASQATCPAMYRQYSYDDNIYVGCRYPGQISVRVNGALWSNVYWDYSSNTVTWYSDAAKENFAKQGAQLPSDGGFNNDQANWNSTQVAQCQSRAGTPVFDSASNFQQCNYPYFGGD